jgi:D-alanyl-D-alanine carboxypeptidase
VGQRQVVMRSVAAAVAAAVLALGGLAPAQAAEEASPRWHDRLDAIIGEGNAGVSVRLAGRYLYNHTAARRRVPASNQKLLVTMALFDATNERRGIPTFAAARTISGRRVEGHLWLLGRGDPTLTGGGSYGDDLPFRPARLGLLAQRIKAAGITRITGSVKGARAHFGHDWWADGWRSYYPDLYAPLATALAYEGNLADGRHIANPEIRAATSLTRKLRRIGVAVGEDPGVGDPPAGLRKVAAIRSEPVQRLVRYMNHKSSNYFAEMMGKKLAALTSENPGTIARGARATTRWAAAHGVSIQAADASGLSTQNRVAPRGLTRLLDDYASRPGPSGLRRTLATGGSGTLRDRLHGVRVHAKTGSLPGRSALSGYVFLERRDRWAAFSILSRGMAKSSAVEMEDRIVRLLTEAAR